ncbi:MAG: DUF445 family protein [Victivallaceae bacterium]|nr:DUF445 family protein [Victivallaceae bacterium]
MNPLHEFIEKQKGILAVATDKKNGTDTKIFAWCEFFLFPASILSIAATVVINILGVTGYGNLASIWNKWIAPWLLAGAVGYLTNWLAILMLFRPYVEKKWLIGWKRGLIPRNIDDKAHKMGEMVGNELLNPDAIAEELKAELGGFLRNPEVVNEAKAKFQSFIEGHVQSITDFLVPEIKGTLKTTVNELVTPENLRKFWDESIEPRMRSEETRAKIAGVIVDFAKKNVAPLASLIRERAIEALDREHPFTPRALIEWLFDFIISENSMKSMIGAWLGERDTATMLRDKLVAVADTMKSWIASGEGKESLGSFAEESRDKLNSLLEQYLEKALPKFTREALESPRLWNWIEDELLPRIATEVEGYVSEHKQIIVDKLHLATRVENAINGMSIPKFHNTINEVAGQHLGASQVLGFILGAAIGVLQMLQTFLS